MALCVAKPLNRIHVVHLICKFKIFSSIQTSLFLFVCRVKTFRGIHLVAQHVVSLLGEFEVLL